MSIVLVNYSKESLVKIFSLISSKQNNDVKISWSETIKMEMAIQIIQLDIQFSFK